MLSLTLTILMHASPIQSDVCSFDPAPYLEQNSDTFDFSQEGWRSITSKRDCDKEVADLIRLYREKIKDTGSLLFHEAQLRGYAGQNQESIELIHAVISRAKSNAWGHMHYYKATIAFLSNDRETFIKERDSLRDLPKPENFKPVDQHGNPVKMSWPVNWGVVQRLDQCWGKADYKTAYKIGC